jgi:hypothetical protein
MCLRSSSAWAASAVACVSVSYGEVSRNTHEIIAAAAKLGLGPRDIPALRDLLPSGPG